MATKIEFECENCGKSVIDYPNQRKRFCSNNCKLNYQYKSKTKKPCDFCGNEIKVNPCKINNHKYHFCSIECRKKGLVKEKNGNWNGGKVNKICLCCNKKYSVEIRFSKRSKFCSQKCNNKYRVENSLLKGENNYNWRGGLPKCIDCGKKLNYYGNKRCRKCYIKNSKLFPRNGRFVVGDKRIVGGKNPNWNGGSSFEPYDKKFNNLFKRRIRKRDNQVCMLCGIHSEKLKRALSVHHINYNKKLTMPENCISLCLPCHMKTNNNRKHWIKFFQELLSEKYGYQYEYNKPIINLEVGYGR
ncbi:MAG: HNH endonuclease [Candidatus Thorarchaeota archaeon]